MATTRLGQIAIGVEPYGVFLPKEPAPVPIELSVPHYAITQAFMDKLSEEWTDTIVIGLNGTTETPGSGEPFVIFEHETVKAFKPVLGRWFFQDGRAELCLYIPTGTGLSIGLALADDLASLFRETEFDGVRTFVPTGPLIGNYNEEGNWLSLRILVPYRFQYSS